MRCHHALPLIAVMLALALLISPLTARCRQLTPPMGLQLEGRLLLLCRHTPDGLSRQCQALF